ncbi:hypothetical protein ACFX11_002671 [Malus domestica]
MSRQSAHQTQHQQQKQQEQDTLVSSDCSQETVKKGRTDRTQYLDYKEGCGFEPGIVTEFPAELWKKPKLNKYGVDEPHAEQVKCELTITEDSSKRKSADNAGQCGNEIDKTTTNETAISANDETLSQNPELCL